MGFLLSRIDADPDLWGHLRFGLDILEHGSLSRFDPYSYLTAGTPWINHEWLAEVFFGLAWKAGKDIGLILLNIGVGLIALGTLYTFLLHKQIPQIRVFILLILTYFPLALSLSMLRPHTFTNLMFLLMLVIIALAQEGRYRFLWGAPLVIAVWTNLHGGFLAGLGILGFWGLLHILFHRAAWRKVIPPILVSCLATLINPYGLDLIVFLLRTATVPRPEITEWVPLRLNSVLGLIYLIILVISILGLIFSRKKRQPELVILFGLTALMPFVAIRHLQLFAMASVVFNAEHISDAWDRLFKQASRARQLTGRINFLAILAALGMVVVTIFSVQKNRIPVSDFYPSAAVSFLKQSGITGNLAIDFGWGEYAIWHLGPDIKVSMDGRRETVYPDKVYKQYLNFHFGAGDWDAILTEYPTEIALVGKFTPPYNLIQISNDWESVYQDSNSAIFVKRGAPQADRLREAAQNFSAPDSRSYFP